MSISRKNQAHLLFNYSITLLCGVVCVSCYAALHQGWLHLDQLFYFQQLNSQALPNEPWRVLSPIFLHHTPLHLLTNLIVWAEFARQIEKQQGSWRLLWLVLLIAIISNTAEFVMVDHRFGGLSGVVIGLGAYIGTLSLRPKQTTWDFPAVYWLALVGLFVFDMGGNGKAAHYVHGTGLVVGLICGAVRWRMQQKKYNLRFTE